ncbi:MAG: carboxylesterase family protein [Oscillospiraceae bacterium]|nr:carboxylesterase family protein [Oscillospiraceae bacterium]
MAKQFLHTVDAPVVQTTGGKLRGYLLDGVYTFHGIKYADAGRFQAPRPVAPWDGVRDAVSFGYVCPLMSVQQPGGEVMIPHRFWPEDEHCQYLNIWTNSLGKDAKMPVMVWIHGGTFNAGSSIEHVAYDGDNMARRGGVVFVTLNHRLNILGHLDMSAYGAKYENSVNAGIADLVAALEWVQGNIEGFGGDPGNVTIFGQSGGGRKTTTLMQTPAAAGLFHKAIIQSGTANWNPISSAHHKKLISLTLGELGLTDADFEKLERAPYPVLVRAYARAQAKLAEQDGIANDWTPVKNGWFMGAPPFHAFTEYAKKTPLLVGSVIAEAGSTPPMPDRDDYPADKRRALIEQAYGGSQDADRDVGRLIELFKKAYPDKNELLLLDFDNRYRYNLLKYAERKHDESIAGTPLYLYLFALEFDYLGGKGAWHCSDIPFAFLNADKVPVCHMEGVMEKLENEMGGAWLNFARTGDPNHAGLPEKWPVYNTDSRGVMVFDKKSAVRFDHEKELVELYWSLLKPPAVARAPSYHPQFAHSEKWVY